MKNRYGALKIILCALAVCSAFVHQANAQSNVTLYGRVDAEVNYQTNQLTGTTNSNETAITGNQWNAPGNMWGTSFFGFKGSEDLGGGMKALFDLESGFATGNGEENGGTALWNRRAYIGLSGDMGTLKLGRDLTLPSDVVWSLDPTGQQAMGTATLAKGRNWPQTSSQVQYISPDFNGFSAIAMYGFGGVAGSTKDNSSSGLELGYSKDGIEFKVMVDAAYDPAGQLSSLFQYSKEYTAGGTLTVSDWKFFAGYQSQSAPDMVASYGNPDKATQYWLGANYNITPNLVLIPAAYHVDLNQNSGSASLFVLGANYYLSKRTIVFASVGTLRNSALTSFAIEVGTSAVGVNQDAFYTGVSHSF